jgi:DnaJ like chaperone protein
MIKEVTETVFTKLGHVVGGALSGAFNGASDGLKKNDDEVICPHCKAELLNTNRYRYLNCPECNKSFIDVKYIDDTTWVEILFALTAKMAKADGIVSRDEAERIKDYITRLELSEELELLAKETFKSIKDDETEIYFWAELACSVFDDNNEREGIYFWLCELAMADNYLDESEKEMLINLPYHLQINPMLYKAFMSDIDNISQKSLDYYYSILGCESDIKNDTLKRVYKAKSKEFHPDTISAKCLPESFNVFASEQMKLINEAYTEIKNSRKL